MRIMTMDCRTRKTSCWNRTWRVNRFISTSFVDWNKELGLRPGGRGEGERACAERERESRGERKERREERGATASDMGDKD
eukprot:2431965-Rhodomonas_salina.2